MKGLNLQILLSLSLIIAASQSLAYAQDKKDDARPPKQIIMPAYNELKNSQDRGINFEELTPPAVAPAHTIKKAPAIKTEKTATNKTVSQTKTAQHINKIVPTAPAESNFVQAAQTQVVASPNSTILSAWLDKGGANPKYKVGEKLVINVTSVADCNVVVFDYDLAGSLKQIFPNSYQPSGYLKAGQIIQIGGDSSPFAYEVGGKGGKEHIFVYAYPLSQASPITLAMDPVANSPFRAAEISLEKYRDLVNKSKVFTAREIKIVAKDGMKPASHIDNAVPANKIELTFEVTK